MLKIDFFFGIISLIIYQASWSFATAKVDANNVAGMFLHGTESNLVLASSDVSDQVLSGR